MVKRDPAPESPALCACACGRPVVQAAGPGGRRKYSEVCRPKRRRPGTAAAGPAAPAAEATIRDRTVAELARLGAAESIDGALLLQLADRMDRTQEGSPYAALARAYSLRLDQVREQHPVKKADAGDKVNELERRRRERQAAAGA